VVGDTEYQVDDIVCATGFDAMTGALLKMDIRGVDGLTLGEKWRDGPRSFLGLSVHGFSNLFTMTGPGSPSVFVNMVLDVEQHAEWIVQCMNYLREEGLARIEADRDAEDAWVAHNREVGNASLRSQCSSWYVGTNVPGKPRVFSPYIGGLPLYTQKIEAVAAEHYRGFSLAPATRPDTAPARSFTSRS
jgi:cyclohexanone monooxygenase